jgi:uncharacterized protein YecE (DUF72 family)
MDITADFVYCRLHGSKELYVSGYGKEDLAQWAQRIASWASGHEVEDGDHADGRAAWRRAARDVYMYSDNDVKVLAPKNALTLRKLLDSQQS